MLGERKTMSEDMCPSRLGLDPSSRGDPCSHSMNNLHFQDGSWGYHLPCHRAVKANISAAKMTSNPCRLCQFTLLQEKIFFFFNLKMGFFSLLGDRSKTWEIV